MADCKLWHRHLLECRDSWPPRSNVQYTPVASRRRCSPLNGLLLAAGDQRQLIVIEGEERAFQWMKPVEKQFDRSKTIQIIFKISSIQWQCFAALCLLRRACCEFCNNTFYQSAVTHSLIHISFLHASFISSRVHGRAGRPARFPRADAAHQGLQGVWF